MGYERNTEMKCYIETFKDVQAKKSKEVFAKLTSLAILQLFLKPFEIGLQKDCPV